MSRPLLGPGRDAVASVVSRAHPPVRLARNGALVLGLTVLVAWTGRAPEARAAEPTATGRTASGRPRLGAQLPGTLTIVTRRGGLVFRPLAAKPTGRKAARTPRHRRPSPALPRARTGVRGRSDLVLTDLGEHYFIPLSDAVDLVRRAWHEAARQGGDEGRSSGETGSERSPLRDAVTQSAPAGSGTRALPSSPSAISSAADHQVGPDASPATR